MSTLSPQVSVKVADPASVDAAITSRFSARAFLKTPVPRATLTHILEVARRAPSGTNTQPWRVYVVQGAVRDAIEREVCAAHDALYAGTVPETQYQDEWDYYPTQWFSPYLERRRHNGWTLYGLLGIQKGEKDKMHAQHQQNFRFFGAPVGLFFTIDRRLGRGSLMDCGMFLQNIMVAARAHGLHTCPQAAWNRFAKIVLAHLGAGENERLVCGMSIGYADESALINRYSTPREPVEAFTRWLG